MTTPKHVEGKLRTFAGGLILLDNEVSTAIADCAMCGDVGFSEANAAELVRRWNCHDELVSTLKSVLSANGSEYLTPSVVIQAEALLERLK